MADNQTPSDNIRDIRFAGVKSSNTDGESVTFRDDKELARLQNELDQYDLDAIARGRVKPRLSTVKFRGIY